MPKALKQIKHSDKIIRNMTPDLVYFVDDLRRASGLDSKTFVKVLASLLKNGYVSKNSRGEYAVQATEACYV